MNMMAGDFARSEISALVLSRVAVIEADAGTSKPANAGAHRLGWYIASVSNPLARLDRLAGALEQSREWIERVVLGEVTPDDRARDLLCYATALAVRFEDWDRSANAEWLTKPEARD